MHPARKRLFISLPVALIAAATGYFLLPWLGLAHLSSAGLFAAGIGIGVIISAMITAITTQRPRTAAEQTARVVQQAMASAAKDDDDSGERKTVFVGNLAYRASPGQLRELFEAYGTIHSVRIATDRNTRKPRGFGFVEMNEGGATRAIQGLHGHQLCDRELNLSEAKQRESS